MPNSRKKVWMLADLSAFALAQPAQAYFVMPGPSDQAGKGY